MDLAELTTFRVGGPARSIVTATTELDLLDAVRTADAAGEPVLLVGGGSNLLVADAGFAGTVVLVRTSGIAVDADACSGATVTVAAGESWDGLVERATREGWVGIEALSGIPGSVGATPIQNVGAYGQEVADTIVRVRTWDRVEGRVRTLMHGDCAFSYRHSRFKAEPDRHVVLDVTFQFALGDLGAPVRYAELARDLGVETGQRAPARAVRDAVPDGAPRFEQPDGTVKTSAAWLIQHAGFDKGHGSATATLSTKHVLALTNRGGAGAEDLLALAREVRDGVRRTFGIDLVNEPQLVGCEL